MSEKQMEKKSLKIVPYQIHGKYLTGNVAILLADFAYKACEAS